jgi:Fe-S oxidoreductase
MSEFNRDPYDPLDQVRKWAYRCSKCSLCKYIHVYQGEYEDPRFVDMCPSGKKWRFEAYYASGKQDIARGLITGQLDYSEKLLHALYTCTECGGCMSVCAPYSGKDPLKTITALRERAVRDGEAPLPEHEPLFKSLENYGNPWQAPRQKRAAWSKKLGIKDAEKDSTEVLLYTGCTYALDANLTDTLKLSAKLLQKAGVDFGILGEKELCCGSTVLRIGDRPTFEKMARQNIEVLEGLGVKTIVTGCAGCYSVLSEEYPEIQKPSYKIVHLVDMLADLVKEGALVPKGEVNMKMTYHDPCHLGRYCGVYDPPREILEAIPGLELVEMQRSRDNAWCCGAGAGVRTAFPDFAQWAAEERLYEASETGAEALVTACPFCEQNLRGASDGMEVKSIFELLAGSVGVGGE